MTHRQVYSEVERLTLATEGFTDFFAYMAEEEFYEVSNLVYMVEKPWKWTDEFNLWVKYGTLDPDSPQYIEEMDEDDDEY